LSELRKGARGNENVRAWFARVEDQDLYVSVLAVGEIRRGIEVVRRRDLRHATSLERGVSSWITGSGYCRSTSR